VALITFASLLACRQSGTKRLESKTERVRTSEIKSTKLGQEDGHWHAGLVSINVEPEGVQVYWSLEHGCGVKPDPRTTVEGANIAIDPNVHATGRRCPQMLVLFRTRIGGLSPGTYELAVGGDKSRVEVVTGHHG